MANEELRSMTIPKKIVGFLAMGLVAIATFDRCQAQSDGTTSLGPAESDAPADAELAVKKAETDRADLEAKWAPAVLQISRQIEFDRQNSKSSRFWIGMLARINTTQSQDLLRRIAIGKVKTSDPNFETSAATSLISCDNSAGWMLFTSDNPRVLTVVLNAVDGQPIDEVRMQLLRKCINHSDSVVRRSAARVMANAPSGELAHEVVECIGQALAAVADIPNVDKLNVPGVVGIAQTSGEIEYANLMSALVKFRVEGESLRELARQQKGRARDTVILAMAQRGDDSVHESIRKLAQDPDAGMFRAWAACGLEKIGIAEDLGLLKQMAATDVLIRKMNDCFQSGDERADFYPVRHAAERTIRILEGNHR